MISLESLQLFWQNSWYVLVPVVLASFILLYIIKNRRDYQYFINLLDKDFKKAVTILDKTDDLALKKRLILAGEHDLTKDTYEELKDYLTNREFLLGCFKDLNQANLKQKLASCKVLSEINTPQAVDYLITALYDDNLEVKKTSIAQLATKADLKIINTFIIYLNYCKNNILLEELAKAFKEIGPCSFKQLKNIVAKRSPNLKIWAIKILNDFKLDASMEEDLFTIYLNLLDNGLSKVKIEVINSLTKLESCDQKTVQIKLLEQINSSEWKVRAQAIKALGNKGIVDASFDIYQAVNDKHPMVRKNAFYALINLGYEGIRYLIKATYESEYKKEVFEVLDELDTEFLIEAVIKLYDIESEQEKKIAKDLLQTKLEKNSNNSQLKVIG